MSRATYTARVMPDSGGWLAIDVEEIPGAFSQARSMSEAGAVARDLIAAMLDVGPDTFDVVVVTA